MDERAITTEMGKFSTILLSLLAILLIFFYRKNPVTIRYQFPLWNINVEYKATSNRASLLRFNDHYEMKESFFHSYYQIHRQLMPDSQIIRYCKLLTATLCYTLLDGKI
jgi:hypothetical protein